MRKEERTPAETAEAALRVAEEAVAAVVDKLRRQSREDVLATLLASGLYPEGASMARKMGFGEDRVHDLLMEAADISDDDQAMISEAVYGFEVLLEVT